MDVFTQFFSSKSNFQWLKSRSIIEKGLKYVEALVSGKKSQSPAWLMFGKRAIDIFAVSIFPIIPSRHFFALWLQYLGKVRESAIPEKYDIAKPTDCFPSLPNIISWQKYK